MGMANIMGQGVIFTVRNTKIVKEQSADTVVLECIGLDNTTPFNIIFNFGDYAADFCYPWTFTLKSPDMMLSASFRDKDGITLVSEEPEYKEVFRVLKMNITNITILNDSTLTDRISFWSRIKP